MTSAEKAMIKRILSDNEHLRNLLDWQIEETARLRKVLREIVKHSDYDDPVRDMALAALGEKE